MDEITGRPGGGHCLDKRHCELKLGEAKAKVGGIAFDETGAIGVEPSELG